MMKEPAICREAVDAAFLVFEFLSVVSVFVPDRIVRRVVVLLDKDPTVCPF